MAAIDLNADLGEVPGSIGEGTDDLLLTVVSSANIACGGHAGDPGSMDRVCRVAADRGVTIGAHVSYPDRENFGRVTPRISARDLRGSLTRQLEALQESAGAAGSTVRYVKPHGALYNDAAADADLADLVLAVAAQAGIGVLTLPDKHLHRRAVQAGVNAYSEAFADRAYSSDGSLVPRTHPRALITDEQEVRDRVLSLAHRQPIYTRDPHSDSRHSTLILSVDSVCLHADTPGSARLAHVVADTLLGAGITIRPFAS